MSVDHPFPGMPLPVTPTVTKPTTSTPSKPLARTAIVQGFPSLPTHPPSSDSCTALVQSTYSDSPRKWIVVDYDGSETWFSGHDGAWGWFMASPFAARLYLLTGGERSLIGGLPYSLKPWHSNSLPRPFVPRFGDRVACYTSQTEHVGDCKFETKNTTWLEEGWRFYPDICNSNWGYAGTRRPGVKFHLTYKECIPVWATPLITKWVLVD
jgi:hypothetical protein